MIDVRTEDEIISASIDYALRVLEIEKQIAELKADIAVIKSDAKLDGVPTGIINKTLNKIKKEMKMSDTDLSEEDAWLELFRANPNIIDKIATTNNL